MTARLFDIFPAMLDPWPEEVPRTKVRAVGFTDGLVVLWDSGTPGGPNRLDLPGTGEASIRGGQLSGFTVRRGPGCSCGFRALRSVNVPRVERPAAPVEADSPVPVDDQPPAVEDDGPAPTLDVVVPDDDPSGVEAGPED